MAAVSKAGYRLSTAGEGEEGSCRSTQGGGEGQWVGVGVVEEACVWVNKHLLSLPQPRHTEGRWGGALPTPTFFPLPSSSFLYFLSPLLRHCYRRFIALLPSQTSLVQFPQGSAADSFHNLVSFKYFPSPHSSPRCVPHALLPSSHRRLSGCQAWWCAGQIH